MTIGLSSTVHSSTAAALDPPTPAEGAAETVATAVGAGAQQDVVFSSVVAIVVDYRTLRKHLQSTPP